MTAKTLSVINLTRHEIVFSLEWSKSINQMKNNDSEPFFEDNFQQAIIYDRPTYRDCPSLRLAFKVVLLFTITTVDLSLVHFGIELLPAKE